MIIIRILLYIFHSYCDSKKRKSKKNNSKMNVREMIL